MQTFTKQRIKTWIVFFFELLNFDLYKQSLTYLMHNKELNLFKQELKYYMEHIRDKNTSILFSHMLKTSISNIKIN